MRIAIDARALNWAGIGRYTRNLLRGLPAYADRHNFVIFLTKRDVADFEQLLPAAARRSVQVRLVGESYYSWREQTLLLPTLYAARADVTHFTHFNVPLGFRRPYVVTIHDITRFIFPGQKRHDLWQQLAYEQVFSMAVRHARQVICVSKTTANDLRSLPLHITRPPVTIYEGVEATFFQPAGVSDRQKARLLIGTRDPFLLYVGVWMSHKNLPRLLAAFTEVHASYPHLKLVMTGSPRPGYVNVLKATADAGIDNHVIFAGFVPPELLPALYQEATCCVVPSLYEGFGLPAIEAQASGTPVLAANVASLPEILGDAAEFVNPEYVPGLTRALHRLLRDEVRRHDLSIRGQHNARQFSWDTAVRQHVAVYESL